jgi:hypothetical protein
MASLALLAVLFWQLVTFKPAWISLDQLECVRRNSTVALPPVLVVSAIRLPCATRAPRS